MLVAVCFLRASLNTLMFSFSQFSEVYSRLTYYVHTATNVMLVIKCDAAVASSFYHTIVLIFTSSRLLTIIRSLLRLSAIFRYVRTLAQFYALLFFTGSGKLLGEKTDEIVGSINPANP